MDHADGRVQVPARFLVDRNLVGAGIDENRRVFVRVFDHQVKIESQIGDLADALDHRRTKGQIRHEMPVHHIHMEHRHSRDFDSMNLVSQAGKIR